MRFLFFFSQIAHSLYCHCSELVFIHVLLVFGDFRRAILDAIPLSIVLVAIRFISRLVLADIRIMLAQLSIDVRYVLVELLLALLTDLPHVNLCPVLARLMMRLVPAASP